MRPEKFWILVVLSITIAALVMMEISNERQTLFLTYEESRAQDQIAQMQRQHEVLMRLLEKMASAAQSDPVFTTVLAKHGIHVRAATTPDANGAAPAPTPASTGASPSAPPSTPLGP